MRRGVRVVSQSFCLLCETEADQRDDVVARATRTLADEAGHIVAHFETHVNPADAGAKAELATGAYVCDRYSYLHPRRPLRRAKLVFPQDRYDLASSRSRFSDGEPQQFVSLRASLLQLIFHS